MDFTAFINDAFQGSLEQVWIMAAIIIPLMLFLEIIKDLNLLDKVSSLLNPLTKLYKMSNRSSVPLMAGLVIGISYGAGIILEAAKSGDLDFRDLYLINVFLAVCHSLFEDTALFMVLGANWIILVVPRLIVALVVTLMFSRWKRLIAVNGSIANINKAGSHYG
ncbi:nucleoside recognition domain-containing protein [Desulfofalx alkaliphila]|uniref:nucleoside recognition domain-containing protein n=1 Tax=Desulfofalx alkaliphila TaxID=105483 RepID=UPI0004E27DB0|nr:nucleoside recognition domain-containing protein [Desulfofalx alkaliphila]